MNQFTKEDLDIIRIWGRLYKVGLGISWQSGYTNMQHQNVLDKLQPMIDNYCEHELKTCWTTCS